MKRPSSSIFPGPGGLHCKLRKHTLLTVTMEQTQQSLTLLRHKAHEADPMAAASCPSCTTQPARHVLQGQLQRQLPQLGGQACSQCEESSEQKGSSACSPRVARWLAMQRAAVGQEDAGKRVKPRSTGALLARRSFPSSCLLRMQTPRVLTFTSHRTTCEPREVRNSANDIC